MTTILPQINHVSYEHTPERLKIILPVKPSKPLIAVYSAILLAWVIITVGGAIYLFTIPTAHLTTTFKVLWVILLLIWTYVWLRLGGIIWRYWQFNVANREIVYISAETLIIRRPVSILGLTDAYDRRHVGAFYYQEKYQAIAFDYGSRGGLFGQGLAETEAQKLIRALNQRYFPNAIDDSFGEE